MPLLNEEYLGPEEQWMMDPEALEGRGLKHYRKTQWGSNPKYDVYEPRLQPGGGKAMQKTGSGEYKPAERRPSRKMKEPETGDIRIAATLMQRNRRNFHPDRAIAGELQQMMKSGKPEQMANAQLGKKGLDYLIALRNSVGSENKRNQIAKLIKQGIWPWDKDPFGGGPQGVLGAMGGYHMPAGPT